MHEVVRDTLYAVRGLRKTPLFAVVALVSLALGIGANTAIFTLIDQLILRLLPIRDPQSIVLLAGLGRHYGGNNGRNALSYPMYQDLRDRNQVFDGMMCRYRLTFTVGVAGQAEAEPAELVSGNYFPLLGVRPAIGRLFTAADDLHASAHPYAVLSYAYWQTRFGGDPGVLGQTLKISNYPVTILGVAQHGFDGMEPGLPAGLFVPISMAAELRPGFNSMFNRRQRWVNVYGRLKPSEHVTQAKAGLEPLFHQIIGMEVLQAPFRNATQFDRDQFLKMSLDVMPGSQGNTELRRQYEKPLWVLLAVAGMVLLIACANLAGLLLARAAARQREIAVRLAVGASRAQMVRQLTTESLLLGLAGGAAGVGVAVAMVKGLLRFLPAAITGYSISSSPDARLLAFSFLLSLASGVAFGLAPALQASRPDLAHTLKDQAGNVSGARGHLALRKALVAAQVALSLLLLIGAGIFLRSLGNLHTLNPGFRTSNLIQFTLSPPMAGYDAPRTYAFFDRLRQRLNVLPGVRASGVAVMALLNGHEWDNSVTIEGYEKKPTEDIDPHYNAVSPGYLEAMGIRLAAGRDFTEKDTHDSPKVALVNETFARRYFPGGLAVGHRFGLGSDPGTPTDITIVGVTGDTRYESLRDDIPPMVILDAVQTPPNAMTAYVRTERDPDSAFRAIRAAVRQLDANLPIVNLKTLDQTVDDSLVTERIIATLSTVFGGLATLLAVIGLYGVMAYSVTQRAREIGIRMALGAKSGNVVRLVMREVLALVGAGLAFGLPAAYALARAVRSQLYAVEATDALSIALATGLLAGIALLAGYAPARRAAACDPVTVLRSD
jgi:predicted permease